MSEGRGNPFSPRTALLLVLAGVIAFVVLLWSIGSGMADPEPQASGAHAGGRGLQGYAALEGYLKERGYAVRALQSRSALKQAGLLVLTPSHQTKPADIEKAVAEHRDWGPTVLVIPKWLAMPLPPRLSPKVRKGFVRLVEAQPPDWKGFHDEVGVRIDPLAGGQAGNQWRGLGLSGVMPDPGKVLSGGGGRLVPLVEAGPDNKLLAGYFADGGNYPELAEVALDEEPAPDLAEGAEGEPVVVASPGAQYDPDRYENAYPLIVVFDPDLLNNSGMARLANAQLAERLFAAALDGGDKTVLFDLTLNGYGRSQNLLQLAFTPPFLAATLCLMLAAAVALWRAYNRFGPPLLAARSIAFGKRALVGNAAGLLRRARRLHLVGAPYADAARDRLVKALALPQRLAPEQAEAAIDRALAARDPAAIPFSTAAADLRAARRPRDMLRAAQAIHSLERMLKR